MASCLTVAALPFLLREGGEQRDERPPTVAAVAPGAEALTQPLDESATTEAPPTSAPAAAVAPPTTAGGPTFLSGGPTTSTTAGTITVAVPTTSTDTTQTGRASFRRWAEGATAVDSACAAWFLPLGTEVTVTNLDNGHAVTCTIADRTGVPEDQLVVLDTPVFAQLADLVEAPIPVTITWQ